MFHLGIEIKDSGLTQGGHDETPLNLAVKVSFSVNKKNYRNALIFAFSLDFRWSLESGLPAWARFLVSSLVYSGFTGIF